MKTLINRIRISIVVGLLVAAGALGFTVPSTSAAAAPECPPPVAGEDGEPVVVCDTTPTADTTAPYVSINNPDEGVTLKRNQTVLITALSVDPGGTVANSKIYVNGVLMGTSNSGYAAASWTPTARGTYVISAQATDLAGNVGTDEMSVTVR